MKTYRAEIVKYFVLLQTSAILFFITLSPAYAYVDPGSGSVIVTTILGFLAAIGYTFRKYFYALKRKISGKTIDEDEE